jgi:hypothetical protein
MAIHSILPMALTSAVDAVLATAGVRHVAHGDDAPVEAACVAVTDDDALALVGPYRSRDVAEVVEITAPAGLALLAPVATWVGVTRDDEPGSDDPADHRGTVLRLVARDMVVAQRLSAFVAAAGDRATVVAGAHEYGIQLDGQLRAAGLPRAPESDGGDVIVLAGLAGEPEARSLGERPRRPVIAFDGVQGTPLHPDGDLRLALPCAPAYGYAPPEIFAGFDRAATAARLLVDALALGASSRADVLTALRDAGRFDAHGDPVDPPVWLWRADVSWTLTPERAI